MDKSFKISGLSGSRNLVVNVPSQISQHLAAVGGNGFEAFRSTSRRYFMRRGFHSTSFVYLATILAVLLLLSSMPTAYGQGETGTISGVVRDPSGGVLRAVQCRG